MWSVVKSLVFSGNYNGGKMFQILCRNRHIHFNSVKTHIVIVRNDLDQRSQICGLWGACSPPFCTLYTYKDGGRWTRWPLAEKKAELSFVFKIDYGEAATYPMGSCNFLSILPPLFALAITKVSLAIGVVLYITVSFNTNSYLLVWNNYTKYLP